MTPLHLFHLNMRTATMLMEANTVITLRTLAMIGAIPARRGENKRMVDEKLKVMTTSAVKVNKALLQGKRADQVLDAALSPVSKRVRANRKRLMK